MSADLFGTGSVVMGLLGTYPKDALVVEGYDISGSLIVHPLIGGFRFKMLPRQAARLREVVSPQGIQRPFRRAGFVLEPSGATFEGWSDGQLKDGWATPHFEVKEAMLLITSLNGRFEETANVFITNRAGIREIWKAREIRTEDGRRITAFAIGPGVWHWNRLEAAVFKR